MQLAAAGDEALAACRRCLVPRLRVFEDIVVIHGTTKVFSRPGERIVNCFAEPGHDGLMDEQLPKNDASHEKSALLEARRDSRWPSRF